MCVGEVECILRSRKTEPLPLNVAAANLPSNVGASVLPVRRAPVVHYTSLVNILQ
jgi:hypothetical protein